MSCFDDIKQHLIRNPVPSIVHMGLLEFGQEQRIEIGQGTVGVAASFEFRSGSRQTFALHEGLVPHGREEGRDVLLEPFSDPVIAAFELSGACAIFLMGVILGDSLHDLVHPFPISRS